MALKPLYVLCLCAGSAVLTGFGRFVSQSSLPRAALDGLFLFSVVATVAVCVYIVVRAIFRQAQDELASIDERRPPKQ